MDHKPLTVQLHNNAKAYIRNVAVWLGTAAAAYGISGSLRMAAIACALACLISIICNKA